MGAFNRNKYATQLVILNIRDKAKRMMPSDNYIALRIVSHDALLPIHTAQETITIISLELD